MLRFLACFAATLVMTPELFSACCPDAAFAASPESRQQSVASSERAAPKSEAAEAWDAVKNTTNRALLEAFIKRYRSSFFAELAKARLGELKATATRSPAALPMPANGVRERAILYEEITSDPKGRQFAGSVIWHTEAVKVDGKPGEIAARADVDIPSRGLRMTMSFRRNLDSSLPASHLINVTLAVPADFDGGGISNVPGILMKANEQAKGMPLAGLSVKVTSGSFLVGLSSSLNSPERNLKLLLERSWFDIPIVYANQQRAILAIDKGASGEKVLKTVITAWGQYPAATEPTAAAPEQDGGTDSAR